MYVRHEQAVVDRVLELAASGVPKLRIAHAFGLSPTTVRRWIRSGGVRVRRPPPCTVDACATRDAVDPFAKHHRRIILAPWQREIALGSEVGAFLRGLIHSDGWRGVNRVRGANGSRYEYPRYMFSNRSDDIRGLFAEACDAIGVRARRMNRWNLSVADAEGVSRLDRFVGSKY